MALTRRTLKDGSQFWDYIDWSDLANQLLTASQDLPADLSDILNEVVETDLTIGDILRGDFNESTTIDANDALNAARFSAGAYDLISDNFYDNIVKYVLYNEDIQKYYGAPSNWSANPAKNPFFYNSDTGEMIPDIVTTDKEQTLTNKTIDTANNAVTINLGDSDLNFTGTVEQFNSALSNGTFVTTDDISSILPLTFKYGTITDVDLDRDNTFTVTFDTPFPNNLHGIQTQIKDPTGGTMYAYDAYLTEDSTTGFTFRIASDVSFTSGIGSVYWFAYGD